MTGATRPYGSLLATAIKALEDDDDKIVYYDSDAAECMVRALLPQVAALLRESQQTEAGLVGYLGLGAAASEIESWLTDEKGS